MKLKNMLALLLALIFVFTSAVPAFAAVGDLPSGQVQDESVSGPAEDEPVPDESPDPAPVPDEAPETGTDPLPVEPPASDVPVLPDAEPLPDEPPVTDLLPDENGEELPALLEDPEMVRVIVPDSGHVIINPYQLEVDIDGETSTEQIAGGTYSMVNLGDTPVTVSASAAGTVFGTGDMVFVDTPPAEKSLWKELFLYVEFQDEFYGIGWSGQYTGAPNQLLIGEGPCEPRDVLTLEAGGTGLYRMFGSVTKFPEIPWSVGDDFQVVLTFTFTPIVTDPIDLKEESPEESAPEDPETPEDPEVPETPEAPEVPETPENPEVPENPEAPEIPETPETPEAPETPETPENPETSENPETPENPETSNVPEDLEESVEDAVPGTESEEVILP